MSNDPLGPQDVRQVRIVAAGMLTGVLLFVAVIAFVLARLAPARPGPLVYFAIGIGLVSPLLASFMRRPGAQGRIARFGVIELCAFVCVVIALVSRSYWPLLAVVVPLALLLQGMISVE